jgi:YVTN family beta-propeller protein
MPRRLSFASLLLLAFALPLTAADKPQFVGPTEKGFLLPNGWLLNPAGKHVVLTDLPLNIIPLADNKHALVACSGFNQHDLSLVNLAELKVVASQSARQTWFGLAVNDKQDRVWWAGGGGVTPRHIFDLKDGKFTRLSKPDPDISKLTKEELDKLREEAGKQKNFHSGLFLDDSAGKLYCLDINAGSLKVLDLKTEKESEPISLGGRPYDIIRNRAGTQFYVSDWAGRQLLILDAKELRVVNKIGVGEHPNQMALHPKDDRLFVACASTNSVSVIDTKRGVVIETIYTALFPQAPEGSTPCAVAVSPDGETLYVANADNNCVAVIDVKEHQRSSVSGFIPTGWYPTSVAVTPDGKNILVGVGKGLQSKANPKYTEEQLKEMEKDEIKKAAGRILPFPYIGTTMAGALSVVPVPKGKELDGLTAQVYKNCPYSDRLLSGTHDERKTAIPTKVGDASPIKYVIYIIKENRTYDQVFGDLKKGNGDPSLVMFGEKITPNHHKLVEEFVLLDNLYCNGQVSRDGHPWSTMAYNTDYIGKDWHLTYSGRKGVDDDDEGHLSKGPGGYLWDACNRAGLSYRSYGEYGKRVSTGEGPVKMEARVPGLVGHICPDYGIPKVRGARVRDTDNVEVFLKEYNDFVKNDKMPKFIVMSLGEDHTSGTQTGAFTPEACVASNDLALGQLVEAVSNGPLWKETAIFVIEDDAQNGPDHVDAHRTVGLVISPYCKRKHLDSTQYSTVSMIRTMELILGLPPLSQYDAAARPMYESFTEKADLTTFKHVAAQVDLNKKNEKNAYGRERSDKMDFTEYDRIDDFELNEILWRAVKGKDAPLPPAVRRAIANRPVTK